MLQPYIALTLTLTLQPCDNPFPIQLTRNRLTGDLKPLLGCKALQVDRLLVLGLVRVFGG